VKIGLVKALGLVAWSFPGIIFLGCFSSEKTLRPSVDSKENISSAEIFCVVLLDSTRYDFDEPARVVNDTIVGEMHVVVAESTVTKHLSIPLSDVSFVCVGNLEPHKNAALTLLLLAGVALTGVLLVYLFSLGTVTPG
jgi:hypothetical protein